MSVLVIAGLGVCVVLVGILGLRLHPLLALLIGSLFLLAATPESMKFENRLAERILTIGYVAESGAAAIELPSDFRGSPTDMRFLVLQPGEKINSAVDQADAGSVQLSAIEAPTAGDENAALELAELPDLGTLSWFRVTGSTLHKSDRLVPAADFAEVESTLWTSLGGQLAEGFAKTFRKLGIPVTMAAVVGVCLLESGAAAKLVSAILWLFGARGTAAALTCSGFVLGVPVYFDNVFYLLLPLAKAVGRKRPETFLSAVMAIIVGATMAHSLVPPTPGPLLVAAAMNVSVGMMMIGGFIVGSIAATAGFAYGMLCHRWVHLSPDQLPSEQPTKEGLTSDSGTPADAPEPSNTSQISFALAAVPIALPILALGGSEFLEYFSGQYPSEWLVQLNSWFALFNDPNLVFIITAVIAIGILRRFSNRTTVGRAVARGISDAGTIVLLTCAGGAFGASLQQLQLANAIGQQFEGLATPWGMLATAFFLTTIIRAAQGSATVAMITSASIVSPVMESVALPFHPIYVALAIGCGSKPLPWMNDSGFWQVATMTGMTPGQTLKTFSAALTLMGLTGFVATLLGAWLLPLV